jgi:hypothetical protein
VYHLKRIGDAMKKYLIYDGRYHSDPDSAMVMCMCDTLAEAQKDSPDYGSDCVIEENEIQKDGKTLVPTGKTWG